MKNFKLLLATTAILSMGTMAANATTEQNTSATLSASVEIERPIELTKESDVDFGKIIVRPNATSDIYVTMTPDDESPESGGVSISSGEAYIKSGNTFSTGLACYAGDDTPASFTIINGKSYDLVGPNNSVITYTPTITETQHNTCVSVGGNLVIPYNTPVGEYTGSVTIDLIREY